MLVEHYTNYDNQLKVHNKSQYIHSVWDKQQYGVIKKARARKLVVTVKYIELSECCTEHSLHAKNSQGQTSPPLKEIFSQTANFEWLYCNFRFSKHFVGPPGLAGCSDNQRPDQIRLYCITTLFSLKMYPYKAHFSSVTEND